MSITHAGVSDISNCKYFGRFNDVLSVRNRQQCAQRLSRNPVSQTECGDIFQFSMLLSESCSNRSGCIFSILDCGHQQTRALHYCSKHYEGITVCGYCLVFEAKMQTIYSDLAGHQVAEAYNAAPIDPKEAAYTRAVSDIAALNSAGEVSPTLDTQTASVLTSTDMTTKTLCYFENGTITQRKKLQQQLPAIESALRPIFSSISSEVGLTGNETPTAISAALDSNSSLVGELSSLAEKMIGVKNDVCSGKTYWESAL